MHTSKIELSINCGLLLLFWAFGGQLHAGEYQRSLPQAVVRKLPSNSEIISFSFLDEDPKRSVAFVKLKDRRTGDLHYLKFDAITGHRLPINPIAPPRDLPVISDELAQYLNIVNDETEIEVVVFLKKEVDHTLHMRPSFARGYFTDGVPADYILNHHSLSPQEANALNDRLRNGLAAVQDRNMQARKQRMQSFVERMKWSDNASKNSIKNGSSSLKKRLTKAKILEIVKNPNLPIRRIVLPRPIGYGLNTANEAMGTTQWAHGHGFRGQGVGVWMRDDGHPDLRHPAIDASDIANIPSYSGQGTIHPTQVAITFQSAAPEAYLYSLDSNDSCYTRNDLANYKKPPIFVSINCFISIRMI